MKKKNHPQTPHIHITKQFHLFHSFLHHFNIKYCVQWFHVWQSNFYFHRQTLCVGVCLVSVAEIFAVKTVAETHCDNLHYYFHTFPGCMNIILSASSKTEVFSRFLVYTAVNI
jgi:hypothetical protein